MEHRAEMWRTARRLITVVAVVGGLLNEDSGRIDLPIDEVGRAQAAAVGAVITKVDRLICSPLLRARDTAMIALPGQARDLFAPRRREQQGGQRQGAEGHCRDTHHWSDDIMMLVRSI